MNPKQTQHAEVANLTPEQFAKEAQKAYQVEQKEVLKSQEDLERIPGDELAETAEQQTTDGVMNEVANRSDFWSQQVERWEKGDGKEKAKMVAQGGLIAGAAVAGIWVLTKIVKGTLNAVVDLGSWVTEKVTGLRSKFIEKFIKITLGGVIGVGAAGLIYGWVKDGSFSFEEITSAWGKGGLDGAKNISSLILSKVKDGTIEMGEDAWETLQKGFAKMGIALPAFGVVAATKEGVEKGKEKLEELKDRVTGENGEEAVQDGDERNEETKSVETEVETREGWAPIEEVEENVKKSISDYAGDAIQFGRENKLLVLAGGLQLGIHRMVIPASLGSLQILARLCPRSMGDGALKVGLVGGFIGLLNVAGAKEVPVTKEAFDDFVDESNIPEDQKEEYKKHSSTIIGVLKGETPLKEVFGDFKDLVKNVPNFAFDMLDKPLDEKLKDTNVKGIGRLLHAIGYVDQIGPQNKVLKLLYSLRERISSAETREDSVITQDDIDALRAEVYADENIHLEIYNEDGVWFYHIHTPGGVETYNLGIASLDVPDKQLEKIVDGFVVKDSSIEGAGAYVNNFLEGALEVSVEQLKRWRDDGFPTGTVGGIINGSLYIYDASKDVWLNAGESLLSLVLEGEMGDISIADISASYGKGLAAVVAFGAMNPHNLYNLFRGKREGMWSLIKKKLSYPVSVPMRMRYLPNSLKSTYYMASSLGNRIQEWRHDSLVPENMKQKYIERKLYYETLYGLERGLMGSVNKKDLDDIPKQLPSELSSKMGDSIKEILKDTKLDKKDRIHHAKRLIAKALKEQGEGMMDERQLDQLLTEFKKQDIPETQIQKILKNINNSKQWVQLVKAAKILPPAMLTAALIDYANSGDEDPRDVLASHATGWAIYLNWKFAGKIKKNDMSVQGILGQLKVTGILTVLGLFGVKAVDLESKIEGWMGAGDFNTAIFNKGKDVLMDIEIIGAVRSMYPGLKGRVYKRFAKSSVAKESLRTGLRGLSKKLEANIGTKLLKRSILRISKTITKIAGSRIAAASASAVTPIPGAQVVSLGLAAWTAWDCYELYAMYKRANDVNTAFEAQKKKEIKSLQLSPNGEREIADKYNAEKKEEGAPLFFKDLSEAEQMDYKAKHFDEITTTATVHRTDGSYEAYTYVNGQIQSVKIVNGTESLSITEEEMQSAIEFTPDPTFAPVPIPYSKLSDEELVEYYHIEASKLRNSQDWNQIELSPENGSIVYVHRKDSVGMPFEDKMKLKRSGSLWNICVEGESGWMNLPGEYTFHGAVGMANMAMYQIKRIYGYVHNEKKKFKSEDGTLFPFALTKKSFEYKREGALNKDFMSEEWFDIYTKNLLVNKTDLINCLNAYFALKAKDLDLLGN